MVARFIAEIGSNHNGQIERIFQLITEAKDAGFWGVKLQLFKAGHLWSNTNPDDKTSRYNIAKQRELPVEFLPDIYTFCKIKCINVGYSVFNTSYVNVAAEYSDFLKIASYEISHDKLITRVNIANKQTFISLGLSDKKEFLEISNIWNWHPDQLIPMMCVSKYPAKPSDCNLNMIQSFWGNGAGNIGWSDHTASQPVILGAVAMGAKWIEVHVDLDDTCGWEYGDHNWTMSETKQLIKDVREMEVAFGIPDWDVIKQSRTDMKFRHNPETGVRGE